MVNMDPICMGNASNMRAIRDEDLWLAYHQESAAAHEQSRREKEMSARFTQVVGRNGAVLVGVRYDV